jgi:di/tricarboxylate transporter
MIGGIREFIDHYSAIIGLIILAVMFVEFARERYSVSVVSVLGACAFLLLGLIDSDTFFGVFSNTAPITIGAMFILSGALVRTGMIDALANLVIARAQRRPRLAVVELMVGALLASAVMNNTPVVVVLVPIMFRLAAATGMSAKRLLMPLSIVAVMGGCLTLIGTSTNLIVDGLAQQQGLAPFGIFEITPFGLAAAAAGMVGLAILGPLLLPRDEPAMAVGDSGQGDEYLSELVVLPDGAVAGKTIQEAPLLRRRERQILGVRRGVQLIRTKLDDLVLKAGDRIVVRASPAELLTLSKSRDVNVGMGRDPDEGEADQWQVVETMISPSHPSIGGRLPDLPFFNSLRVRILGVSRHRHLPGPDLGSARVRAADRLLVAAAPGAVRSMRENIHLLSVAHSTMQAFRPDKAPIALVALAATVILSALDVAPIGLLAILAVGAILLTRCIDPGEAWQSINGDVLILIFAMLAVGEALEAAGSVTLMLSWITPLLTQAPPWLLVFLIYGFSLLLSELLSNNAVAAVLTPIVIALGQQLGIDPRPLVIALMISASVCFATPIGYQTNAIVYAAGDYRFADFVRIGVPLNILTGAAACFALVSGYELW